MTGRLLVTGAGGMLGRDVLRAAAARSVPAVGLTREELDVTDPEAVEAAVARERPEVVVHCAAWTDVDGAEGDEAAATAVNGAGTGHVAAAAARAGAALVHVSTDYVFDGRKAQAYVEDDPVGPLSAYGRSKLAGERAVAEAGGPAAIVRTSWLFGVDGPNFAATMLRLGSELDEVAVVVDQVGCPTWTGHLAEALLDVAEREAWGVHHVAGAGECSWHAFAREIFRQADLEVAVHEQTTQALGRPAPRPANSRLRATRTDTPHLPAWTDGLAAYLTARRAQAAA